MTPVFGAALSALLLREGAQLLGWTTLAALALVCAGIWAVNAAPRKNLSSGRKRHDL